MKSSDDERGSAPSATAEDRPRKVFELHRSMVYSISLRYTLGDRDAALDLTQKVFIKVFTNLHTYDPEKSMAAWVATIAHNTGIDYVRALKTERQGLEAYGRADVERDPSPERELILAERRTLLREAVEAEPESELKTAGLLFYEEELTVAEIAERTGASATAVTTRLSRFRARIKKRLARKLLED